MRIFVFIEKDFPYLVNVLKNNFPDSEIKGTNTKSDLLEEIEKFKPQLVIANFYTNSDVDLVKKITSNYPLIIISDYIEPDTVINFQKSGIVDWILFRYIDRIVFTIKIIQKKLFTPLLGEIHYNRFTEIINRVTDYSIIIDTKGNILSYNESFAKNFSNAEILQKRDFYSLIFSEDRENFRKVINDALSINIIDFPELRLEIEGKLIYTQALGHCIHNERKEVEKIVLLLHDISQQKESESKLKESERLFRAIAETAAFSVFIYQDNKFVYINPTAVKFLGYSEQELMQMNFWDVVHPDFIDLVKERGLRRLKGELVPARYEFKILKKDKTERWIDFSATFIEYKGKPAALGIAFDITDRKIADEKLKSSHDFYLKLFNEFPTLLWRTDPDGNMIFFNKTWLDFRGKKLEEEIAGGWIRDIHPDDVKLVVDDFEISFHQRKSFEMEYRIKNSQNVYRWVYIIGCPFYDPDKKFSGFIGSGYDITDKKEYEGKINNLNKDLQDKIKNLEDFKSVAIERELKMMELKEIIKRITQKENEIL